MDYILDTVKFWREEFGIDGLRLDVAYCQMCIRDRVMKGSM